MAGSPSQPVLAIKYLPALKEVLNIAMSAKHSTAKSVNTSLFSENSKGGSKLPNVPPSRLPCR